MNLDFEEVNMAIFNTKKVFDVKRLASIMR
jgi:hypothetical protein